MFADQITVQQGMSPIYAWAALVVAVGGLVTIIGTFLKTLKELGHIKQNVDGKMTDLQNEVNALRQLVSKSVYTERPVTEKAAAAVMPAKPPELEIKLPPKG